MNPFAESLLQMSDSSIDGAMKPLIEKWSDPPTPKQVLEVLDHCINGSLASGFVVSALQALYEITCKREGVSHEEVLKDAPWRQEH